MVLSEDSKEPSPLIKSIAPQNPDPALLREAAGLLQSGQLVAFPTETVYGLGANALDPDACRRIFIAKGRPSTNPLIVHVSDVQAALEIAHWTPAAQRLAAAFWPGPLTLVLKRKSCIPDEVTAGGDTVAVRIPDHPVALALLKMTGFPVAAPSANRSNAVSPTRALHVAQSLGDRVRLILDGGPCKVGIESTVLDLTTTAAQILRPGQLNASQLENALGQPIVHGEAANTDPVARSPGQMARHYAPLTPIEIMGNLSEAREKRRILEGQHQKILIVASVAAPDLVNWGPHSSAWAENLYEAFHRWDAEGWDRILLVPPDRGESWAGVLDRLTRASQLP